MQMQCCVTFCRSNSSKPHGVSFYAFPPEPDLRAAWIKALGKKERQLTDKDLVCSKHFIIEDLYVGRDGSRKIRAGAVPFFVQVCGLCNDTVTKMYTFMNEHNLLRMYKRTTKLWLDRKINLPRKLCSVCSNRLLDSTRFKDQSSAAQSLMMELVRKRRIVNMLDIYAVRVHSVQ